MANSVAPATIASERTLAAVPTAFWASSTSLFSRLISEPVLGPGEKGIAWR